MAGFLFKLETTEGRPAEPPTLSSAVPNWSPGDVIPLGSRSLLVVGKRDQRCRFAARARRGGTRVKGAPQGSRGGSHLSARVPGLSSIEGERTLQSSLALSHKQGKRSARRRTQRRASWAVRPIERPGARLLSNSVAAGVSCGTRAGASGITNSRPGIGAKRLARLPRISRSRLRRRGSAF
jgi:hypothetical protein